MDWLDRPAFDVDGGRLGIVSAILVDAARRPQWLVVRRPGWRRGTVTVPAAGALVEGRSVVVDCLGGSAGPSGSRRRRRRGDCT